MLNYKQELYSEITLVRGYVPPSGNSVNLHLDFSAVDVSGAGSLSGTYPDGITSINNVPTQANISVSLRSKPGSILDGIIVATTMSSQDGTWVIVGLSKELRFNVVARLDGYNDVIASNITPL